jgi:hypothetical protein
MRARRWSRKDRRSIFAGVVMRFAVAVDRLRNRGTEVDYAETTVYFDFDEDGGLAPSRVPRRPSDRSGSGSAAVHEPEVDDRSSDIRAR